MGEQTNLGLMTTYTFKGREHLVQMNVLHGNTLDLSVTDKLTAELWNSNFDSTYIENQTHKTGNYKQFDIFISMLKSGLLKTSDCVTLDLLTFDDLESLRSRRTFTPRTTVGSNHLTPNANRRYLIVTYTVEFDRIHYPLPLDYSGPPDPQILQAIIRRLEGEVTKLQKQVEKAPTNLSDNKHTQLRDKRINELTSENELLMNQIKELKSELRAANTSNNQTKLLREELKYIEEKVLEERSSFHELVRNLRAQKRELKDRVNELQRSERALRRQLSETCRRPSVAPPRHRSTSRDVGGERGRGVQSVTTRHVQSSSDRVQHLNRLATMRHADTRSPSPQLFHRWSSPTRVKDKVLKMTSKVEDSSILETLNKPTLQIGCVGFYPPPQTQQGHRSSSDISARSRKPSLPRVSHSSPTHRPENRNTQEMRCMIGDHKRASLDATRLVQVRSRSSSPHVALDVLLQARSRSNSPLTNNPIVARQQSRFRRNSPLIGDLTEQRQSQAPSPPIPRDMSDRARSRTSSPLMRNNSRPKSRSPAMTLSASGDNYRYNRGRSRTRREQRAKYPSTSSSRVANRANGRPCSAYSNSSWSSEGTGPNSTGDGATYAYPRMTKECKTQGEPNHMLEMKNRIQNLQKSLNATKLPFY